MSTTEETTVKVFVSYSSKDREFVLGLAERLQQVGLDIWLDVWRITGREPYWNEIQAGIESATHILFVISPTSISDNSAARDELAHAKHHRKTVVLVMAKAVDYDKLPLEITPGRYQIHDFTRLAYEEGILRVYRAITSATPPPRATTETPVPSTPSRPINWTKWGVIVTAVGILIAAMVTLVVPFIEDSLREDDNAQTQNIATATATATETPSPTATDTETPTPTPSATDTATPTATETPTTAPSDTPQPEAVVVVTTLPPSNTPAPSDTPPPTATLAPTVGPTLSYPCTGTVVNPFDNNTLITEVYAEASTTAAKGTAIRVGTTVTLQRQLIDSSLTVWYLVYSTTGQRHGWTHASYIEPSAQCPS